MRAHLLETGTNDISQRALRAAFADTAHFAPSIHYRHISERNVEKLVRELNAEIEGERNDK